MSEDGRFGCAVVAGLMAFALVMIVIVSASESYACTAKFQGSKLESKWGLMTGCRVNTPEQGWIPAANYRVL